MAGPLQGVRIVEMGQLIAIPSAMKWMADLGAEVIRLESVQRLESYRTDSLYHNDVDGDFWNRGANFYEQNRNKLGLTLDLSRDEGREVLRNLISVADVFAENFTPRVIRNFGLEYEDLKKIRPDIIMVSSTGYGFEGPWANFGATGPATEGAAGLAYMTGYKGGGPMMSEIPYTDYTAGEHTVAAVMLALMHRLNTGQGQFIDISQTQTCSATIPEALFSFPYCLAAALCRGQVGIDEFHPSSLSDQQICDLANKVTVNTRPAPDRSKLFLKGDPDIVTVTMRSGVEYSHSVDVPHGAPPRFADNQTVERKFFDCASRKLGDKQATGIRDLVFHMNSDWLMSDLNQLLMVANPVDSKPR